MPSRSQRGATLIEVVISVLIVAVVSMSVFSVALVGRQDKGRVARRAAAALAQRRLLEELRNYVTADLTTVTGPGGAPNGWGLAGDFCNCWALKPGNHTLSAATWLPTLVGEPYKGSISYRVTAQTTPMGDMPTVDVDIHWSEP